MCGLNFFCLYLLCVSFTTSVNIVSSLTDNHIVINTWAFTNASQKAWEYLENGKSALDAVQAGCTSCEDDQCDTTVGYGGSPDENGESTLDAMLMDGNTLNVGAVGGLRRIKPAISVARLVLDHTSHSLLVGDLATDFAKKFGVTEEPLYTCSSLEAHRTWKEKSCQPNFWMNVTPDPTVGCGPYQPGSIRRNVSSKIKVDSHNHDTIGMIAIDIFGNLAAGTSSNGAKYKIPGRVGDSPIPGAGCYADGEVGAAAATGDGDIMMRLLPSFLTVEEMRRGKLPMHAAMSAIARIAARYPTFQGGIVALSSSGEFGAACHGLESFPYTVSSRDVGTTVFNVSCT